MRAGPTRVLEALRRAGGQTGSGEGLSIEHGISRAQVWKHVETLRARGYTIDADPGDGYRLSGIPDRLYAEEIRAGLETRWLAREIHDYDGSICTLRYPLALAWVRYRLAVVDVSPVNKPLSIGLSLTVIDVSQC